MKLAEIKDGSVCPFMSAGESDIVLCIEESCKVWRKTTLDPGFCGVTVVGEWELDHPINTQSAGHYILDLVRRDMK